MVPDRDFVVTAWSGSFALRVACDALRRRGASFERGEGRPLLVEPVSLDGAPLLSGLYLGPASRPRPHPALCWREVGAGSRLTFTFHVLDEELTRRLVTSLAEDPVLEEPACRLTMSHSSTSAKATLSLCASACCSGTTTTRRSSR